MNFLLNDFLVKKHIEYALLEDIGYGDISTDFIADDNKILNIELKTREDGIICGLSVFRMVFQVLNPEVCVEFFFKDGDRIKAGDVIAKIQGSQRSILTGERLALNYIQKMSGISTYTNLFVEKIKDYKAKIVDTRKNTPCFRMFEKYAIKVGGATLHRFNLSDCVMLKDNHIAACGSIAAAVKKVRDNISHAHKIEIECDTKEQVEQALEAGADIIMLDNMTPEEMAKAIEIIDGRAETECSGNITKENIAKITAIGVDYVSSGALTHSAPILDISLKHLRVVE